MQPVLRHALQITIQHESDQLFNAQLIGPMLCLNIWTF